MDFFELTNVTQTDIGLQLYLEEKKYRTIGIPGTETGIEGVSARDYGAGFSHPRTECQPAY